MGYETVFRITAGSLLLILGWQLCRLGVRVTGFCLGFVAGAAGWELVLAVTAGRVDLPQGDAANIAAGVVLGIIGAYLSIRVYKSILFLAVAGGCLYLGYMTPYLDPIYDLIGRAGALGRLREALGDLLPGALALILAVLALWLHRHVVIVVTAGMGAHLISSATPYPILFFPLFLAGVVVQAGIRRDMRAEPGEQGDPL